MPLMITDVDRVLLNYDKSFKTWLAITTETSITDISSVEFEKLHIQFSESSAFGYLKPYDDAVEWFTRIAKEFKPTLIALSSCGDTPSIETSRYNNLQEYFPNIFNELIMLPYKSTQRSILRRYSTADLFVSANWHFAYEGASEGISSAYMNRNITYPYKELVSYPHDDFIVEVETWEELFDILVN